VIFPKDLATGLPIGVSVATTLLKTGTGGTQYFETTSPTNAFDFSLDIQDFAAYSKLKVELIGYANGGAVAFFPGTLPAFIEGRPASETYTTVPIDRGEGIGIAGNKIADSGWDLGPGSHVADSWAASCDDDPNSSRSTCFGDGFTALEEYRGVVTTAGVRPVHLRMNPAVADVFIINSEVDLQVEGIDNASKLFPTLNITRLSADDVAPGTQIVNYLTRGGFPQFAIEVKADTNFPCMEAPNGAKPSDENPALPFAVWGYAPRNLGQHVAPMAYVCTTAIKNGTGALTAAQVTEIRKLVIAHEVGHCVGMPDYYLNGVRGLTDSIMLGVIGTCWVDGVPVSCLEHTPSTYSDGDFANLCLLPGSAQVPCW